MWDTHEHALFTQHEKLRSNRAKSLPTTEAPFQELSNRIYLTTPKVLSHHRKMGNTSTIYVLAILKYLLNFLHTKGTIYTNTSIDSQDYTQQRVIVPLCRVCNIPHSMYKHLQSCPYYDFSWHERLLAGNTHCLLSYPPYPGIPRIMEKKTPSRGSFHIASLIHLPSWALLGWEAGLSVSQWHFYSINLGVGYLYPVDPTNELPSLIL